MTSAASDAIHADSPDRHRMLASALAGRPVEVVAGRPGEPAWSDGHTIMVDPGQNARHTIEAVVVHAALIGAGSLSGATMRPLLRSGRVQRRFLHVEGPRAIAGLSDLLPRSLSYMVCEGIAMLSDSPAGSLALARTRIPIPECAFHLGMLRPREVLSALRMTPPASTAHHKQRAESTAGPTRAHDMSTSGAQSSIRDDALHFSTENGSTLGGRLLRALLRGAGPAGADGPEGGRSSWRSGGSRHTPLTQAARHAGASDPGMPTHGTAFRYPEWDSTIGGYRRDWCSVRVVDPEEHASGSMVAADLGMRRALSRLGTGPETRPRQTHGDDIDIDAAVETRVGAHTSPEPDEQIYLATVRDRRDLSALILLDVSGSANEPGVGRVQVHEHQRSAVAALATTMHRLGDRVAVYAFSSHGRHDVRLTALKTFAEHRDRVLFARLHQLQPCGYSRLGAAIRHAANIIEQRGGTTRRLLIVVSDGLAFDHGYDLDHGADDVRRALTEVRARGTGCLCLTVGSTGPSQDLERAFGTAAHASVAGADQLAPAVLRLFRAALNSAEVPRNRYSRKDH